MLLSCCALCSHRNRLPTPQATAYVWPAKMSIYASMVPQYNTEFLRAGEQAMSASGALEQGDKRFASFRGLPVYETEAFGTCLSA